ncbi:hypothetical protein ACQ4PT_052732 [Festuca glaucescens]
MYPRRAAAAAEAVTFAITTATGVIGPITSLLPQKPQSEMNHHGHGINSTCRNHCTVNHEEGCSGQDRSSCTMCSNSQSQRLVERHIIGSSGALDLIPRRPTISSMTPTVTTCTLVAASSPPKRATGRFRVVTACHDESRARTAVFSPGSREWQIFPWSEPVTPHLEDKYWLKTGTMVNGSSTGYIQMPPTCSC